MLKNLLNFKETCSKVFHPLEQLEKNYECLTASSRKFDILFSIFKIISAVSGFRKVFFFIILTKKCFGVPLKSTPFFQSLNFGIECKNQRWEFPAQVGCKILMADLLLTF